MTSHDTKDVVPGSEHLPSAQPCHDRPRNPPSRPAADTDETHGPHVGPLGGVHRCLPTPLRESCQSANISLKKTTRLRNARTGSPEPARLGAHFHKRLHHHAVPPTAGPLCPEPLHQLLPAALPCASGFKRMMFSERISASTMERRRERKISAEGGGGGRNVCV